MAPSGWLANVDDATPVPAAGSVEFEELSKLEAADVVASDGVASDETAEGFFTDCDCFLVVTLAGVVAAAVAVLVSDGCEDLASVCANAAAENKIAANELSKIRFIHSSLKMSKLFALRLDWKNCKTLPARARESIRCDQPEK